MLNTTIPTLEIKTTGIDLSTIESLYITIKQGDYQIVKSNDSIEVDNDIIFVSLTQSESSQLKMGGGGGITVTAAKYDGEVSNVRIAWIKSGSHTSHSSSSGDSGGGGGESTINNEVWYPTVSDAGIISWIKSTTETPPSPKNIKGKDGITPHIDSSTGNWFIGTTDTGIKAKGEDGKPGSNGITPTIVNDYWYIGTTSTGVKAVGTDGFSPTITENPDNNADIYKLDITTKTGTFTTPNLKGKDGEGGSGGGISEQEVQTLIDDAFLENMSGAKIAKNEKGEWGYIPPGADAVIPFSKSGSSGGDGLSVLPNDGTFLYKSNVVNTSYVVVDSGERLMVINRS